MPFLYFKYKMSK